MVVERARRLVPSVNALPGCDRHDNGKPVARRGRKATGLTQVAGLPNRRWTGMVQVSPRVQVAVRAVLNVGVVLVVLLAAAANYQG